MATLSPRDQKIVALRFVEELTQAEIGAELGVTQMQVSRLLTRILATLRDSLDDDTSLRSDTEDLGYSRGTARDGRSGLGLE